MYIFSMCLRLLRSERFQTQSIELDFLYHLQWLLYGSSIFGYVFTR